jgi:Polyketide cyclase / dehydrase and lipid transport
MSVIHHNLSARCRPDQLWQELSALEAVGRHNPTIRAARLTGTLRQGVGAIRECDLLPKGKVVERVTVWDEGRSIGLEVVQSDWPIRTMQWVTRIESQGTGSTLIQRLEYKMKFGPIGWVLDNLVLRRKITRNVGTALNNLVALAEGGSK